MTLTEFLLARIAEDEETAEWAASRHAREGTVADWSRDTYTNEVVMCAAIPGYGDSLQGLGLAVTTEEAERMERPHGPVIEEGGGYVADHIERWDPARVLAECEAKRGAIDAAWDDHVRIEGEWGMCQSREQMDVKGDVPGVIQHLAAVYSDHPDYRDEWRP